MFNCKWPSIHPKHMLSQLVHNISCSHNFWLYNTDLILGYISVLKKRLSKTLTTTCTEVLLSHLPDSSSLSYLSWDFCMSSPSSEEALRMNDATFGANSVFSFWPVVTVSDWSTGMVGSTAILVEAWMELDCGIVSFEPAIWLRGTASSGIGGFSGSGDVSTLDLNLSSFRSDGNLSLKLLWRPEIVKHDWHLSRLEYSTVPNHWKGVLSSFLLSLLLNKVSAV